MLYIRLAMGSYIDHVKGMFLFPGRREPRQDPGYLEKGEMLPDP